MDSRALVFLIVLGACSCCCNAKAVTTDLSSVQNTITSGSSNLSAELQINQKKKQKEKDYEEDLCTLCEVLAGPILEYLSDKKSQLKLISSLHLLCDFTFILKNECNALVDYYLPHIYRQSSVLTPRLLCEEVGLCDHGNCSIVTTFQHIKNSCKSCHQAVTKALLRAKHLESQMIALLLKACNAVEGSAENCKRLVLAYASLISVYAKPLLETGDVCNLLPACNSTCNPKKAFGSETSVPSSYQGNF